MKNQQTKWTFPKDLLAEVRIQKQHDGKILIVAYDKEGKVLDEHLEHKWPNWMEPFQ